MSKYILLCLIVVFFTGCATKFIGGVVDVATLGIVKNDVKIHYKKQDSNAAII